MDKKKSDLSPQEIVDAMFANDDFSKWLGIEILEVTRGSCVLRMVVREEMTNGFNVAHGGITFSFADSAFAFASNSLGKKAVSVETSISHVRPVFTGDILTARAIELNSSNSLALFNITITNQNGKSVAFFKGTVFRVNE